MGDVVNLDALIWRDDFNSEEGAAAGEQGKSEASKTDLSKGENFYLTLRKPDFQRETAAWSPESICNFLESFVGGDLIPAVICWQSASRLTFVIDGAHRLSTVIAWLLDDYGAGDDSIKFYNNNIPLEQRKVHDRTRTLVNQRIGSYKDIKAEAEHPGSNALLSERARSLGHAKIPLLWVKGNDSKKAEKAFLTINQSAVAIDPTEFTILNSRNKANAISSRVIVRNGTGHKYWKDFSSNGQEQVVKRGKYIYSALYDPPLDPPIKTAELPIAGHGYGTQTLPLIFDFVNIANDIQVVDSSKKSKLLLTEQGPPDESATAQCLARAQGLADIFTGTHPSSLGLHPAVYFYSVSGRHQPTAVLAIAALFVDLRREDKFIDFTKVRGTFEEFLLDHKVYINQLTVKHGSMAKGFRPLRDYYRFVLDCLWSGKSHEEIEFALSSNEKYRRLVKEKPILSKKPKKMSKGVKQYVVIAEALAQASICELCEARIDLKAMHVDHIKDRSKGGAGSGENARPLHPYCDSTYKRYLENEKAVV
jgi:5-methylcytosine-specific restriction endonuclease McrA